MMETGGSAAQATQSRATAAIDGPYSAHRLVHIKSSRAWNSTLRAYIQPNKTPTNVSFMLVSAATKIPWKEIIRYGPPVIKALHDAIKQILNRPKRSSSDSIDSRVTQIQSDLEDSLRALEAASEQGAKRIQELAAAGQILAHRITIAIAVALLSTILATVAIVPALIYRN